MAMDVKYFLHAVFQFHAICFPVKKISRHSTYHSLLQTKFPSCKSEEISAYPFCCLKLKGFSISTPGFLFQGTVSHGFPIIRNGKNQVVGRLQIRLVKTGKYSFWPYREQIMYIDNPHSGSAQLLLPQN